MWAKTYEGVVTVSCLTDTKLYFLEFFRLQLLWKIIRGKMFEEVNEVLCVVLVGWGSKLERKPLKISEVVV